jgi:hypothetical protein
MAYHMTGDHARAIEVAEQALALVPLSASGGGESAVRQEIEAHLAGFTATQQKKTSTIGEEQL